MTTAPARPPAPASPPPPAAAQLALGAEPARAPGLERTGVEPAYADAARAWSALAHVIAGRPRVRVSRDGGRTYPRSRERALTAELPLQPAAVLLYDADGNTRCLAADFDSSRGGAQRADRDAATLQRLITTCGGHSFADRSPNGGRHVYLPLRTPVPHAQMRQILAALAALLPTLDTQPGSNILAGCIRPPGARHKTGGWQQLTTDLTTASAIAAGSNPAAVWDALSAQLQTFTATATPTAAAAGFQPPSPRTAAAPGTTATGTTTSPAESPSRTTDIRPHDRRRPLTPETLRIAQLGDYDLTRYPTPSQARQRVLAAAASAGWSYTDITTALNTDQWPGLSGFYDRYRPAHRTERLAADWCKAVAWLAQQPTSAAAQPSSPYGTSPPCTAQLDVGAHTFHTRAPHTQAGAERADRKKINRTAGGAAHDQAQVQEYRYLRSWWNAALRLERIRYRTRAHRSTRLVLRALGNAAQKAGSRHIEFGCRSLSLATNLDHSTVAAALRRLRSERDPLLLLVEDHRGVNGDLYELRIPDDVASIIGRRSWRAGTIPALHPTFRALGTCAGLLYEQLAATGQRTLDLADNALLGIRTTETALLELAVHGLAERTRSGWTRGPIPLDTVATALDIPQLIDAIRDRHQAERTAWRALLGSLRGSASSDASPAPDEPQPQRDVKPLRRPPLADHDDAQWLPPPEPPDDPDETLHQLLYRVLGAVPIPV